jgi:hypothetical protein
MAVRCLMSNVFLRQANGFFGRFLRFGGSMALFLKLLCDELMKFVVEAVNQKADVNPFELTVDEQLAAFRAQNDAGGWGVTDETFARLVETAPAWPKGKDAYRSFRIRWGKGAQGVYLTFERHWEAMQRVHAKHLRWPLLHSKPMPNNGKDVERLRLLKGNDSHHAVVEWVVVDNLSTNRKRKDVTSVRGPQSLADEGLVLAWLNPRRVEAIDYKKWCAWFCGGYEVDPHMMHDAYKEEEEEWQRVVVVFRNTSSGIVKLYADLLCNRYPDFSVPLLG